MPATSKRICIQWLFGSLLGTLVIAATSPWFVRSYVPHRLDTLRQVSVPEEQSFRWRSEGYATTQIGPHGMPGQTASAINADVALRVALWGDSQAEGVCVADSQKLFARIEQSAAQVGHRITVLPFARSGDDAAHWLTQMPSVERQLAIDAHLILLVEPRDLLAAVDAPLLAMATNPTVNRSQISSFVPAFVIQAVRHLITNANGSRRQLRFTVGPTPSLPTPKVVPTEFDWRPAIQSLQQISELPMVIVYAPQSPRIAFGKVELHDPWREPFQELQRIAVRAGLTIVDTSDALGDAARQRHWPHGFHNGQIGSGHLNADGYEIIASQVVPAIVQLIERKE